MDKKSIVILFGSRSQTKLKAVRNAADKLFRKVKLELLIYDASSEINSQPIGQEETIKGAINRLENTKKLHREGKDSKIEYDYVIGIESGLINIKNNWLKDKDSVDNQWLDLAYIVIEHKSGVKLIEQSATVEFPYQAVVKAEKAGYDKNTAADFMKDLYFERGVDADELNTKDPHKFLLDYTSNRMDIIASALELGFARILAKINSNK